MEMTPAMVVAAADIKATAGRRHAETPLATAVAGAEAVGADAVGADAAAAVAATVPIRAAVTCAGNPWRFRHEKV
jgi:hypothetical protein